MTTREEQRVIPFRNSLLPCCGVAEFCNPVLEVLDSEYVLEGLYMKVYINKQSHNYL